MTVDLHHADDLGRLRVAAGREHDAKQRDRYRVVLLAAAGDEAGRELHREQIAARAGRSRQFVDEWVGRYRRGGLDALAPRRQPGARPKLDAGQERQLRQMIDDGPPPADGIAAYNGPILRERLARDFGVLYSLSGTYDLLHRLGYNDLMPRPKHPGTDPAAQEAFKKTGCPPASRRSPRPTQGSASCAITRTRPASGSTAR